MSFLDRFPLLLKQFFDIVGPDLIILVKIRKGFADDDAHHTAMFVEYDCSINHISAFVLCLPWNSQVLFAVEVGSVWDIMHVGHHLQMDLLSS